MTLKNLFIITLFFCQILLVADSRGRFIPPEEVYRTALHEAGHTVVAWHYGHNAVKEVWVNDVHPIFANGYLGLTEFNYAPKPTVADLWHEAVTYVAGGQSQAMFTDGNPEGTSVDLQLLKDISVSLRSMHPGALPPWPTEFIAPSALNETMIMIVATFRAEQVLSEREKEVRAVAAALVRKHRLSHEELAAILGPPGRG